MTIKSITVIARHTKALATQYLGQPGFDNVKKCNYSGGKLVRAGEFVPYAAMGYEIRMGEFIHIGCGEWVVTPDPATETFILSNGEFCKRYIME